MRWLLALALLTSDASAQVGPPPLLNLVPQINPSISAPVLIASALSNVATTTVDAPAGSVIIACATDSISAALTAVSDGTNTYTSQVVSNATGCFTTGSIGARLLTGATITATISGQAQPSMVVAYIVGLTNGTADKTATASNAVTVSTTGLTQANELAIGWGMWYNNGNPTGTPGESNGFTSLKQFVNYGASVFTSDFAYKILSSTAAATYAVSGVTQTVARITISTYKGK